jgi:hypothetical protein
VRRNNNFILGAIQILTAFQRRTNRRHKEIGDVLRLLRNWVQER